MAKKTPRRQPPDLSPTEIVVDLLNYGYRSVPEIQQTALDKHGTAIDVEVINQTLAGWQEKMRIQSERRNNISTFWANEKISHYQPALQLTTRGECLDISTPNSRVPVCVYLTEKDDGTFGIKVELSNWVLQAIEDAGYTISRRKSSGQANAQPAAPAASTQDKNDARAH